MKFYFLLALLAIPAGAQPLRLALTPGESQCEIGSSPVFTLTVANPTRKPVTFTYVRPTFWYPSFVSQTGKVSQVQGEVYDGPAQPVRVTVPPGKSQELPTSPFRVVTASEPGNRAQWVTSPGEYRAKYRIVLRGVPRGEWTLDSNTVKLRVTAKGEH